MSSFEEMPLYARAWIYQAGRDLSETEVMQMKKLGNEFIEQWTAHGKLMRACFEIKHRRFLVILADEKQAEASGCGIDKSVNFIKEMEKLFSASLLDRSMIAYLKEGKIHAFKFTEAEHYFENGELNDETIVFNNLVPTKAAMETDWEIPLKKSWLKQRI